MKMSHLNLLIFFLLGKILPCLASNTEQTSKSKLTESESSQTILLPFAVKYLDLSSTGKHMIIIDNEKSHLYLFDLISSEVRLLQENFSDQQRALFTPDGRRVIWNDLHKKSQSKNLSAESIESVLKVFDLQRQETIEIARYPYWISGLSLVPRLQEIKFFSPKGLHSFDLYYRGSRKAPWQLNQREQKSSFWVINHDSPYWVTGQGYIIKEVGKKYGPVTSWALSPDGFKLAWADKTGRILLSDRGEAVTQIGYGRHPRWHPHRNILLYSRARIIGRKIYNYDLGLWLGSGRNIWLNQSQQLDESFPQWVPGQEKILYAMENTRKVLIHPLTQLSKKF